MEKLVDAYMQGHQLVKTAIDGLSDDLLHFKPSPEAWSVKEIVVHLSDAELVAVHRMKKIIAETNPLLTAFDQDLWTDRLHYATLDHRFYLELFRMLRESMGAILRTLPPDGWARTGIHNAVGKVTLQDIVESYIEHVAVHLRQIERNKAAFAVR